jgi:aminoglycoside phosphotransferase (APT) family kinase protein
LKQIAVGREAEVFLRSDGAVVKVLRDASRRARAEQEASAMGAVHAAGGPAPAPISVIDVDGHPAVVMEHVAGPDLLSYLGRRPWSVFEVGRRLGDTHARVHEVVAPPSLPDLRPHLEGRIRRADLAPEIEAMALRQLDLMPDGDRLCHGDFHPANVLLGPDGESVIDWTDVTRGDPQADVARTRLMLRMGDVAPGTATFIRLTAPVGRGLLLRAYLRAYGRQCPLDETRLAGWELPHAAARLGERIPAEVGPLTKLLERRRLALT